MYSWNKASDGTYTIFSVEIFSQHGEGLRDYEITPEEVGNAVYKLQEKQKRGYLAPIHQEHFGQSMLGDENKHRIGYLCNPRKTQNSEYGETLTVDFIGIQKEDFAQIQSGKWPYRSIEGYFEPDRPDLAEVFSLALMESAPPFFKYKLLYLQPKAEANPGISVFDVLTASEAEQEKELVTACQGIDNDYLYSNIKRRFSMNEENKTENQPKTPEETYQDEAPPAEEPAQEEVPGWAQELMTMLADIKAMLGDKMAEDKPDDEEKPEEKMSVQEAVDMAALIAEGITQASALKMAKAGIKFSDLATRKGVAIPENKPKKAVVKEDDFDYQENKDRMAFANMSKAEYIERMQARAHLYFPDKYELDETGNVRRVK